MGVLSFKIDREEDTIKEKKMLIMKLLKDSGNVEVHPLTKLKIMLEVQKELQFQVEQKRSEVDAENQLVCKAEEMIRSQFVKIDERSE